MRGMFNEGIQLSQMANGWLVIMPINQRHNFNFGNVAGNPIAEMKQAAKEIHDEINKDPLDRIIQDAQQPEGTFLSNMENSSLFVFPDFGKAMKFIHMAVEHPDVALIEICAAVMKGKKQ